ncbi:hypothetical protein DOY81_002144 [Sarcophaga bullata]|nr:hypothetical protein DOY81_002144 [Sarcophaga bullata]
MSQKDNNIQLLIEFYESFQKTSLKTIRPHICIFKSSPTDTASFTWVFDQ